MKITISWCPILGAVMFRWSWASQFWLRISDGRRHFCKTCEKNYKTLKFGAMKKFNLENYIHVMAMGCCRWLILKSLLVKFFRRIRYTFWVSWRYLILKTNYKLYVYIYIFLRFAKIPLVCVDSLFQSGSWDWDNTESSTFLRSVASCWSGAFVFFPPLLK